MTKPSYEELRITKHSASPQSTDSASGSISERAAMEIRDAVYQFNRGACRTCGLNPDHLIHSQSYEFTNSHAFVAKKERVSWTRGRKRE